MYLLLEQHEPNKSKKLLSNYFKIHGFLKLWRMRNLSVEGKIVVFKTVVISKLAYLTLLTVISSHITDEVTKIQKFYLG